MKHRFTLVKPIAASMSNIIANYLDIEHLGAVHSSLSGLDVISESPLAACFVLQSKILGLTFKNVHYYEYCPPNRIIQSINSPLGPMVVRSTVEEVLSDTKMITSRVIVETEIDLACVAYPFRRLIERVLRASNQKILDEDLEILVRRTELFGDYIEDYLRPSQPLLFKEAFRGSFSKHQTGAS